MDALYKRFETWREAWWAGLSPTAQKAMRIANEALFALILAFWGAITALDLEARRGNGWLYGAMLLMLAAVVSMRNYWLGELSRTQKDYIKLMNEHCHTVESQNEKLKDVALAAAAVQIEVRHGLPINLEPLTRYLEHCGRFFEFQKTDLSEMD